MHAFTVQTFILLIPPLFSFALIVPPLTTPSRVNHNITVPSLGTIKIRCWIQPAPPATRLPKANVYDCYSALQAVLLGDKALAPMHFTEDARRGFKVPFAWGFDSCQIVINNVTPRAEDTFPMVLIAHLAAEITEACIYRTPGNLGGDVKVGSHDQFEVLVSGTGSKSGVLDAVDGQSSAESLAVEKRILTPAFGTSGILSIQPETTDLIQKAACVAQTALQLVEIKVLAKALEVIDVLDPCVIQDSDDEDNIENSPVRPSKPAIEGSPALALTEGDNPSQAAPEISAIQSTSSTEVLSRDIQDAYNHLIEPSTSRSSRSSHPSVDTLSTSKRRATTDFELGTVKKPKITYGARKSKDEPHLGAFSDDEEPVKMRKRARTSTDLIKCHDGTRKPAEDQNSGTASSHSSGRREGSTQPSTSDYGRASDASMPPPASRTPVSSRQLSQSSNDSVLPSTERASSQLSATDRVPSMPASEDDDSRSALLSPGSPVRKTPSNSKIRKRAVSEIESPKIILGEELPPSSSAPAESPVKRGGVSSTPPQSAVSKAQSGSGEALDELSLLAQCSSRNQRQQATSQENESKTVLAKACQADESESDDLVSDLPKENYQPRPSRSRSALTADEVVIPQDFSKRPEALVKPKKVSKRRKTTAFEDTQQAVEPVIVLQQDSSLEADPEHVLAGRSEPIEESSLQLSPPQKKSRGRPKKDAAPPEESICPPVIEAPSVAKDVDMKPASPVKQASPARAPAKRGRKRKKPAAQGDESSVQEFPTDNKSGPAAEDPGPALAESDPNIQPPALRKDDSSTLLEDVKPTVSLKSEQAKQPPKQSTEDSSSPVKPRGGEQTATPKTNGSAKQESKSIYRVGLSKRQRIPSLLRVVRK